MPENDVVISAVCSKKVTQDYDEEEHSPWDDYDHYDEDGN